MFYWKKKLFESKRKNLNKLAHATNWTLTKQLNYLKFKIKCGKSKNKINFKQI